MCGLGEDDHAGGVLVSGVSLRGPALSVSYGFLLANRLIGDEGLGQPSMSALRTDREREGDKERVGKMERERDRVSEREGERKR